MGRDAFQYIPLTFHIIPNSSVELDRFSVIHAERPGDLWIVKPGEDTNRGFGIEVSDDLAKIKMMVSKS